MTAEPGGWVCKTCGRHATLGSPDCETHTSILATSTSLVDKVGIRLQSTLLKCPNTACGAFDFVVSAQHVGVVPDHYPRKVGAVYGAVGVGKFRFLPTTSKPLSAKVPAAVQADYQEANLIRDLSPKAAATLARRALQGMLRDFWGISERTLAAELKAIQDKCDAALYEAMMGLKSIGNIGAHPEADVSLIIEIEPGEAAQLLDLIHLLDQEWYVARESRAARIAAVTSLAAAKKGQGLAGIGDFSSPAPTK